jgi:hypothetical protein
VNRLTIKAHVASKSLVVRNPNTRWNYTYLECDLVRCTEPHTVRKQIPGVQIHLVDQPGRSLAQRLRLSHQKHTSD